MIARRQLPVASPITPEGLRRACRAAVFPPQQAWRSVADTLRRRFDSRAIALTDSGTSALVLALRLTAGQGGTIAYPAYACPDLAAAARYAGVQVRLYDIDPLTLSPDMESVRRILHDGVNAIVVVHLFGFPADVPTVRTLAAQSGIPVIEDAAQGAGATLRGTRAGALGDLSVLSFGRGKGTTAGNGGALLALNERWHPAVEAAQLAMPSPERGMSTLTGALASWALGRPEVYGLPASIPALHLGETTYHDAHEPASLSHAGVALLETTLASMDRHVELRRYHASVLSAATHRSWRGRPSVPIRGGEPGYLRLPFLAKADMAPAPQLGIVRSYPRPLSDEPAMYPLLLETHESLAGARELASRLLTLPVHHMVTPRDLGLIGAWLRLP